MPTKKIRFPKKELNTWVKNKESWSHEEWLCLLELLRTSGFDQWTDNSDGQDAIGLYIESKRKIS
ncbi:MAG: hypothetical protein MK193_09730 [Lentisphaeria bacterium]|nr:hypothetical protein [Lentisphaeria bacterium]